MTTDIAAMLDAHGRDRTGLLDMLWEVQRRIGYISAEAAWSLRLYAPSIRGFWHITRVLQDRFVYF